MMETVMDHSAHIPARQSLLGVSIDPCTMAQAVKQCTDALEHSEYMSIGVVNAAKIVAMRRDIRLREAVGRCRMILADGQSVVWASRILRVPVPERVAGIDLFQALLAEVARRRSRVYFLGARPDVLKQMLDEVGSSYPGLVVAGARDGYFQAEEEAAVAEEIRSCDAELLFLGMSSPKKELFLSRWGEATGARVVHGVGGSFDVLAGVTRRAPLWYQKHGLEWFYRARQEPLRLGRRYLTTNVSFIALVGHEMLRNLRSSRAISNTSETAASAPSHARRTVAPGDRP
jgi:N-acetylglucosaminyldiphosphoundecaprenol N-acetyl-beta-D-mannosaminyltransferase